MNYKPFKTPFWYDDEGYSIMDAYGNKVIDIRGWGYLTGKGSGAKGYKSEKAKAIQDNIGKRVAELMNKDTI